MILIINEMLSMREFIKNILNDERIPTDEVKSAREAFKILKDKNYDLIILDMIMPEMNGLEFLKRIREFSQIPIIFVTASADEKSQIMAYDNGADGYIIKPFSPRILISIINRFLRKKDTIRIYEEMELHLKSRRVLIHNREIYLPAKEREILFYLWENIGIIKTRNQILNSVWGYDFYGSDRVVDRHMTKLRNRLGRAARFLQTIKMIGYKFDETKI